MAAITVTPRQVSPLVGAIVRNYVASGSGNVGDAVRISGNRTVAQADAGASNTAGAHGVVVAAGAEGATTYASGDGLSVVTHGPVAGFAGTAGALAYVGTAGAIADAAGTTSSKIGRMEDASTLFVMPDLV